MLSLLLIHIFFNYALAQDVVDSLRAVLPKAEGTSRVDMLNSLAGYISINDARETMALTNEALETSGILDYDKGKVKAWLVQATLFSKQSKLDKTDSLTHLAMNLANITNDQKGIAMAQLTFGALNIRRGKLDEAIQNHIDGLKASNMLGDPDLQQTHTMNIGHVKRRLGELDEAEKYFKESLKIAIDNGLNFRVGQVYLSLGFLEYEHQNLDACIDYYEKALPIFIRENEQGSVAMILNNLGYAYYLKKDNTRALDFYNQSQEIRERIGDRMGLSRSLMNKALIAKDRGDFNRAESLAHQAEEIVSEIKNAARMIEVLSLLAQIYEKQQDFRNAFEVQREYSALKDSVAKEANSRRVAELTAQFELERKENELVKNQQQISLLASEQELLQTRQFLLISIISLLLIITFFIWVYYHARVKRARISEHLAEEKATNEELKRQQLGHEMQQQNEQLKSHIDKLAQQNLMIVDFKQQISSLQIELNGQENTQGIEEIVKMIERKSDHQLSWQEFRLMFDEVYPQFIPRLLDDFPKLTANELDISVLLKMNLPNKDISQILNISYDAVKKSVLRLYKKLNFESGEELRHYMLKTS
ncbi:MAG: hypothetical protein Roseis2KO_44200 [Roseivirga sp.]